VGRRDAIALALLVGGALAYAWLYGVRLLPDVVRGTGDFVVYLQSGAAVLAGRSPYALAHWDYPPLLSFLVAPLAALPFPVAARIWFALEHLALAFAALWVWRHRGRDLQAAAVVALTWAAAGALAPSLREGQVNALLLALLVLVLWPPARARWLAPAALGAAVAIKLWPGVLWLGQLGRERARELATGTAWAALLVLAPLLATAALDGPLLPRSSGYWLGTPAFLNGSLPAVALRALDPLVPGAPLPSNWVVGNRVEALRLSPAHQAASAAVALGTLAVGLALLARRLALRASPAPRERVGAALIALALVAAPICWPHYHVLQLPGVALLATAWARARRWGRIGALALAFLAVGWTEAVVMGPYLAAYGADAGAPALAWFLSTLPAFGAAALFALHLAALGDADRGLAAPAPTGAAG
jgi:hypothetical protein